MPIDSVMLAVFWALLFTDLFTQILDPLSSSCFFSVLCSLFAAEDCWHFCWLKVFYLFLLKGTLTIFCFLSASIFDLSLFHLVLFLAAHTAGFCSSWCRPCGFK